MRFEMVVIGVSVGGLHALTAILSSLQPSFPLPILIVQHMSEDGGNFLSEYLDSICPLTVSTAEDKSTIQPGVIYIAPAGYHMLVEDKKTIALSLDPKVNYSRPSIDVLFESAADVFGKSLMGIILSGANTDGVNGAKKIKSNHGYILVQSLESAESPIMPGATINEVKVDNVLDLNTIGPFLNKIGTLQ